jgi:hypothetical protein
MDEPVKDAIGLCGIADLLVPARHGQISGLPDDTVFPTAANGTFWR